MIVARRTALAGLGAAAFMSTAFRAAAATTKLVLSHHLNTQHIIHETSLRFAARVAELTGGQVEVDVRPNAQLFNLRTSAEALQLGTLDLAWTDLGSLANWKPYLGFVSLPFVFRDLAHVEKVFYGPVGEQIVRDVRADLNIDVIGLTAYGFRVFYSRKPLRTVDDMRGIKLRVPEIPVYVDMARALGANPTPIPVNEVYTALQTGVVDASEGAADYIEATKLYEVSKYLTETNHIFTDISLMASSRKLASLSPEHQATVRKAAQEVVREWYWKRNLEIQNGAFDSLAKRMEVVRNADVTAFRARMSPVVDSFVAKTGAKGRAYLDAIRNAGA